MVYRLRVRAVDVLGPQSPLSRALDAYEDRPGQLAMADAVENALAEDRPLFVEAGTGTGKTLAYLVPAILSGKKIVISTATRALEDQIFTKDLPLVREALLPYGITFRAALMKGLANYLCKRRFAELRASGRGVDRVLAKIEDWAAVTETGDRAELVDVADDAEAWREVQSGAETRIGQGCPHFESCFVTQMRRDAEAAQIVVVNHHLFFADLALRRGRNGDYASAIPNYDAVIFDEAHQMEDVATDFFGTRVSSARVEALARDAKRSLMAAKLLDVLGRGGPAHAILEVLIEASQRLFSALGGASREERKVLSVTDWNDDVSRAHGKVDAALEALHAYAAANDRDEAVAMIARRARDLRIDLEMVMNGARAAVAPRRNASMDEEWLDEVSGDAAPPARVTWLDVRERSVSIGSSPIDLGPTLRQALFDRIPGVICTSATLATSGTGAAPSFHFAKARLGAPPETTELVVPSPFHFETHAALYLTRDLPAPNDPSYDAAAAERARELIEITRGGAFVLCTSTRAMKSIHKILARTIRMPLMVQGEAPKHLLLSKFRAAGNAVLVATMSFWEGVDVPGHALRLVVIDKIPFAVPTDPIVQARCAQIEREGGNAFTQYSVPAAAITLKQGFGRLLRTKQDAGIVAVLDPRVLTKGYGKRLLASLPPAQRCTTLEEVTTFWTKITREQSVS